MVREPVTGKKELVTHMRALTTAIEVTDVPARIDKHLKDIISLAKRVQRQDTTWNRYWLNN